MTTSKTAHKHAASEPASSCACAAGRKAVAVDPEIKAASLRRLARIEGQVRGLQKMVESERYCADILVQIGSVQQALRGVSRQLMRNHLKNCAADAIRKGSESADAMYDELLDLVYLHAR
ncbi:MAG TPA: metal-sensitive transcriptional regulator [Acidisarcina sp.]|nr:metal-sensitive transcriptional regulator [Acidisarcina sp.]